MRLSILMIVSFGFSISHANEAIQPSFDCAAATSKIEKLICKSSWLAGNDRALSTAYSAAAAILKGEALAKMKTDQREWMKKRDGCFEKEQIEKKIEKCVNALMVSRTETLRTLGAEASLERGPISDAEQLIKEVKGHYCVPGSTQVESEGEPQEYPTVDELEITPTADPQVVEIKISTNGDNGHSCGFSGRAIYTKNKEFVHLDSPEATACKITLRKTGEAVEVDSEGCGTYCGVRASIGGTFRFTQRVQDTKCPTPATSTEGTTAHSKRAKKKKKFD